MDFELPEELRMFKQSLRRFVNTELIPVERDTLDGEDDLKPHYREKFIAGAKALGIWMMEVPEEYGGPGLHIGAQHDRGTAQHRGTGARRGITARQARHSCSRDENTCCRCYAAKRTCCPSSPMPAPTRGMRTTAMRDGDFYVINSVKLFITGAHKASFMQLMAATDRAKGSHGGISCFLVDMNTPGVKLTTSYQTMMGDRPWEIVLDNVRVPASHRVGEEGGGFKLAQRWLGAGRVKHGARALGVAERCLEMATSYAKQRSTFGRPLADRQGIQWKLADIFIELQAARLLVYKAATRLDKGEDAREDAYVCKYFADEMAFRAADQCMQIHGGIGLTTDLPIEKLWRQQRSYRITEGASEVMKMVIARHVLKAYG